MTNLQHYMKNVDTNPNSLSDKSLNNKEMKTLKKIQNYQKEIQRCEEEIKKTELDLESARSKNDSEIFIGKAFLTFKNFRSRMVFLNRYSDEYVSMPIVRKFFSFL